MRLGAGYGEERRKKIQEEQQITPSIFQHIAPQINDNNNIYLLHVTYT